MKIVLATILTIVLYRVGTHLFSKKTSESKVGFRTEPTEQTSPRENTVSLELKKINTLIEALKNWPEGRGHSWARCEEHEKLMDRLALKGIKRSIGLHGDDMRKYGAPCIQVALLDPEKSPSEQLTDIANFLDISRHEYVDMLHENPKKLIPLVRESAKIRKLA